VLERASDRLARFRRESQVLASLSHPNIGAIHALEEGEGVTALVRRLLHRCLEKDRKRRLDSAAAARLEIDEALTASSAVDSAATPSSGAVRA
jgi:hypothetical protein